MKDYYYILGVKKEAPQEEIRIAYRKLSQKFHPDKNDGDDFFVERFKEIQEAYEILSNLQKKSNYDTQFANRKSKNASGNNGYNFDPIIDHFKSSHVSFKFEDEITFSWKTINADKVYIRPFGSVRPIDQKTYKIKDFKNPTVSFEITAENSNTGRYAKQILILNNKTYQELYNHFQKIIDSDRKEQHQNRTNHENYSQYNNRSKKTYSKAKFQKEFETDKGSVIVNLNFENAIPAMGNEVFQNKQAAKDGKYKLGFMNNIVVRYGLIIDLTMF